MQYRNVASVLLAAVLVIAAVFVTPRSSSAGTGPEIFAGVNGAWFQGPGAKFPTDLEAGGTAKISLSPHISAVGSAFYGFTHSYVRGAAGGRLTVTDVNNPNFNTFLGALYRFGSTSALTDEVAFDAGLGWRPMPARWPNLIFIGEASTGYTSGEIIAQLGARYSIPLK